MSPPSQFASSVKRVRNRPIVNELVNEETLRKKLKELQDQLLNVSKHETRIVYVNLLSNELSIMRCTINVVPLKTHKFKIDTNTHYSERGTSVHVLFRPGDSNAL